MSAVTAARGPVAGRSTARRTARWAKVGGVWLILATIAASTLYPLFFLTMTSFRTEDDYVRGPAGIPQDWTFDNITKAFVDAQMGRFALNSLIVVVTAVILIAVLASMAAYALTLFEFPLRNALLFSCVLMIAIPLTLLMIPIFKVILDLGLLNTRLGLIAVYTAISLPFSTYLLASFMRTIPRELIHAAQMDGAGPLRVLWSVVLPLVRPGLLTVVTLMFLFLWNELLFSLLILQEEDNRTLIVGITQFKAQRLEAGVGVLSASLLMSMIPPFLIFALFHRDLARGLTGGAVK